MAYYEEVVQPLQWCVMDIQRAGMLIDMAKVQQYTALIEQQLKEEQDAWQKLLGHKFNPNASQQVLSLFHDDFRIPLKNKKGENSADVLTLLLTTIDHPTLPIVEAIISYRELIKDRGTYLRPEPWPDGRVRSQFRVYGTLTWRLSSKEPDLQNIPREARHGVYIKNIYIAPPGRSLGELDYSALEDRIPAYASGCSKLIGMFERGENTHLYRAGIIFGKPLTSKDEDPKKYSFAKRLRYSRGYGASVLTVAQKLLEDSHEWHPPSEIGPMLKAMDDDVPEIMAWHNQCWADSEKTGLSFDGFGIPRVLFEPPTQRRQVAYSDPTQRTASGIMNRAMVRYYHAKRKGHFHKNTLLICQVHDSLMMEADDDYIEQDMQKLKVLMEEPVDIFGRKGVLFPVEGKAGKSWGSMKSKPLDTGLKS